MTLDSQGAPLTHDAPVTLAVVGAGNRGRHAYGGWVAAHPGLARVVAVAEPDPVRLARMADQHGVPTDRRYRSWEAMLSVPRLADAVLITTPDRLHVSPALAALRAGYDILLEKPIAPDAGGVLRLAEEARALGRSVTIGHVLRYTPFFTVIKRLLDEGRIGQVMTIHYTENVGYWHFAHSFVRGNWRNEAQSSPFILAKSCHDLDMLRWLAGAPCLRVSSFGSLSHFRPENAPQGAPARCTDGCPAEPTCPFSAVRFYTQTLAGHAGWPVNVITEDLSPEGRLHALRTGPYGRCVYRCDNDVVDHQVAIFEFANGATAAFTVTGFTEENTRTLKIMGTAGEIRGHLEKGEVELRTFAPARSERILASGAGGHSGGDEGLMEALVRRLQAARRGEKATEMLTSLEESVDSHLMAMAAERSRHDGRVVEMEAFRAALPAA